MNIIWPRHFVSVLIIIPAGLQGLTHPNSAATSAKFPLDQPTHEGRRTEAALRSALGLPVRLIQDSAFKLTTDTDADFGHQKDNWHRELNERRERKTSRRRKRRYIPVRAATRKQLQQATAEDRQVLRRLRQLAERKQKLQYQRHLVEQALKEKASKKRQNLMKALRIDHGAKDSEPWVVDPEEQDENGIQHVLGNVAISVEQQPKDNINDVFNSDAPLETGTSFGKRPVTISINISR